MIGADNAFMFCDDIYMKWFLFDSLHLITIAILLCFIIKYTKRPIFRKIAIALSIITFILHSLFLASNGFFDIENILNIYTRFVGFALFGILLIRFVNANYLTITLYCFVEFIQEIFTSNLHSCNENMIWIAIYLLTYYYMKRWEKRRFLELTAI